MTWKCIRKFMSTKWKQFQVLQISRLQSRRNLFTKLWKIWCPRNRKIAILHVCEVENWELLNKDLFQFCSCVLIFLPVNTIQFKLLILLSVDLQNHFDIGYWPLMLWKILLVNWKLVVFEKRYLHTVCFIFQFL